MNIDISFDRTKELIEKSEKSDKEIERDLSLPKDAIYNWTHGVTKNYPKYLPRFAKYFEVSHAYLTGETDDPTPAEKLRSPNVTEDVISFRVMGTVAAGYDYIVYEDYTDDTIDIARSALNGRKDEEYFVLRVVGQSMYPQYHEGDYILVLKQETLDYYGQIGVVLYDDDKVTLKRVEYAREKNQMRLVPVNPQCAPITIRDEALEHCRILGIPKLLIREIENG